MNIFKARQVILFKIIYSLKYFSECLFMSYTGLYLLSLGFSKGSIGTINSITALTTLLVNPIWAIIAKDNKTRKLILVILTIVHGLGIIVYGNLSAVELIMALTSLIAIAAAPYVNILDSFCIMSCEAEGYEYSKVRIMGSIFYLIGFLIGGAVINYLGYGVTFMIAGSIVLLNTIFVLFINYNYKENSNKVTEANDRISIKEILTNKAYVLYMIANLLCFAPSSVGDAFLGIYLTEVHGFNAAYYSYLSVSIVFFEILFTYISPLVFKNFKKHTLLSLITLLILIKTLTIAITNLPLWVIIIGNLCRGAAVGITTYNGIKYIFMMVGAKNVSSATIISGVISSILSIALNNVVGYLIDIIGYNKAYLVLASIIMISLVGYPLMYRALKIKE